MKLTTHFHPIPWLTMCGAIPALHHTSTWCGAYSAPVTTLPFFCLFLHEEMYKSNLSKNTGMERMFFNVTKCIL
jgi:hypothetical protein